MRTLKFKTILACIILATLNNSIHSMTSRARFLTSRLFSTTKPLSQMHINDLLEKFGSSNTKMLKVSSRTARIGSLIYIDAKNLFRDAQSGATKEELCKNSYFLRLVENATNWKYSFQEIFYKGNDNWPKNTEAENELFEIAKRLNVLLGKDGDIFTFSLNPASYLLRDASKKAKLSEEK